MSREPGRRILYGIGIPVAAALFIAAMLWAMSRVLLAVDPAVAPLVALLFAANILVASALAVILRGRRAFVMITAVILGTFAAGGIGGAVAGEWPVPSHVAGGHTPGGEETEPPPPTESPTGEPTEPPTGEPTGPPPEGETVEITAQATAFDTSELSLPADKPSTIVFDNQDPLPHNVAIYTAEGGEQLFAGQIITATTAEYPVPPLQPGSYYFQCDVHPTEMNGTVAVG
jgi:plastocyanin